MPAYATDLSVQLLDARKSVQEIVEGIKRDPNVVGIVLKTVNSAQFAFQKKIESFYHACMILTTWPCSACLTRLQPIF